MLGEGNSLMNPEGKIHPEKERHNEQKQVFASFVIFWSRSCMLVITKLLQERHILGMVTTFKVLTVFRCPTTCPGNFYR